MSVAKLASFLSEEFSTREDQYKALFYWVTHHIEYDVLNMFTTNLYSSSEDAVQQTLDRRKALCQGYVELTHAVCSRLTIPSYSISGYTRQLGRLDPLPHSWLIISLNGQLYISDPTWASGHVKNQLFVPAFNPGWYLCTAEKSIQSHMPFDPMWQLSGTPVLFSAFDGTDSIFWNEAGSFAYQDSILAYSHLSRKEQVKGILRRIAGNGIENELILKRKKQLSEELTVLEQNETINSFNEAVVLFNKGVANFNTYVQYKNKRFLPAKPEPEIRGMADTIVVQLSRAAAKLNGLVGNNAALNENIKKLLRETETSLKRARDEILFISRYYQTPPGNRNQLFIKKN